MMCHLGSGASVCAMRDGKSVDTSMGFTPLEGLVMGTRSGDMDPGLLLYLMRTLKHDARRSGRLLNKQSGLLGLSGRSGDVRDLEAGRAEAAMPRPSWRWNRSPTASASTSARMRPRWAAWTPWPSPAASASIPPRRAPASARGWSFSACNWMRTRNLKATGEEPATDRRRRSAARLGRADRRRAPDRPRNLCPPEPIRIKHHPYRNASNNQQLAANSCTRTDPTPARTCRRGKRSAAG